MPDRLVGKWNLNLTSRGMSNFEIFTDGRIELTIAGEHLTGKIEQATSELGEDWYKFKVTHKDGYQNLNYFRLRHDGEIEVRHFCNSTKPDYKCHSENEYKGINNYCCEGTAKRTGAYKGRWRKLIKVF